MQVKRFLSFFLILSFILTLGLQSVSFAASAPKVTKIAFKTAAYTLTGKNKSTTLKPTVSPSGTKNNAFKWKSSNPKVVKVNQSGKITAKASTGNATITAVAKNGGKKASIKVYIGKKVTAVKLNKGNFSLNKGKTFTLKATVSPSKAAYKKVKWTTSDKTVATVSSSGVVKGIKAGKAKITATSRDGTNKKKTITVTVKNLAPKFAVGTFNGINSEAYVFGVEIENKGTKNMTIQKKGMLLDDSYYDYDRDIYLMDEDANFISKVVVKPKEVKFVFFAVDYSDYPTWYDANSTVRFYFTYDGIRYGCDASSIYGVQHWKA